MSDEFTQGVMAIFAFLVLASLQTLGSLSYANTLDEEARQGHPML
jgi:hypothetical protein